MKTREVDLASLIVRPLNTDTWDAFAALCEKHNGVWGGCWCTWFHTFEKEKRQHTVSNRELKARLVREGHAHAALVFDGKQAVAWCQYGSPQELKNIRYRKEYEATQDTRPDYRLTCFFVDRDYRRQGVASVALQGALDLIAAQGGGVVEAYPQDTQGQKTSGSFLHSATRSLFERAGFTFDRTLNRKHTVMRMVVPARD